MGGAPAGGPAWTSWRRPTWKAEEFQSLAPRECGPAVLGLRGQKAAYCCVLSSVPFLVPLPV